MSRLKRVAFAVFSMLAFVSSAEAQLTTGDEARSRTGGPDAPESESPHRRPADSWSQFDSAVHGDGEGIKDDHPMLRPVLAQHPDRDLVLCLAGCGGGVKIVTLQASKSDRPAKLQKADARAASVGEMEQTQGSASRFAKVAEKIKPAILKDEGETFDVICVAGCNGKPGEVVGRNVRLSWISNEGRDALKVALRDIAERIAQGQPVREVPELRQFMSSRAREALLGPVEWQTTTVAAANRKHTR